MRWPEIVWTAAVLRGLDARARADLSLAGKVRDVAAGARVFAVGDAADAFFVVARGSVDVRAVRRGDATADVVRSATAGEAFGEEATVRDGGRRTSEAFARGDARVAEIPVAVFRRAAARSGGADVVARIERTLRRAATLDLFATVAFARDLAPSDRELLADASEERDLARGEALFRIGDAPTHAYFVADGMIQVRTEDDDRVRVRAFLSRGDLVTDDDAIAARPYDVSAVAIGPTRVVAVPRAVLVAVSARYPGLLADARRVVSRDDAALPLATQHAFQDLYRLDVARSLLVIDQESCVRCGHCAWSCADAHDDGIARLARRGDKVATRVGGVDGKRGSLLVPTSCQHCESPACMVGCPTGAIGRDPRGEVFIRADICIGCASCAKACPWDNIQMAPRAGGAPDLAIKCDLCVDRASGPACVAACPTRAIARVRPTDVLPDVRAALQGEGLATVVPRPAPAWPWIAGAALGAIGLIVDARAHPWSPLARGVLAGLALASLAAYALVKRVLRARLRPHFVAHLALGAFAMGAVVAHAGARVPPTLAGALHVAFWATALLGVWGALAYRVLPARLSRLEHGGALPEDLAPRQRVLDEQIYATLSGKSDVVKTIFDRVLLPYLRSPTVGVAMLTRGRAGAPADERSRLRGRIDAMLKGRTSARLAGLDDLVRLVVERASIPAQRAAQVALRAWLPAHVVLTVVTCVLLVVHAVAALVFR